MSTGRTIAAGGVLALALAAIAGGRKRDRPSMGRRPVAAADLERYLRQDCTIGTIYQTVRGDIVLGRGPKSITWRALRSAAELQGVEHPERIADDGSMRVQYAGMICAAPFNAQHLTDDPGKGYRRPGDGLGIDTKAKPAVYLPVPDFDLLELGIVAPATWENGESTLTLPPEIREYFA